MYPLREGEKLEANTTFLYFAFQVAHTKGVHSTYISFKNFTKENYIKFDWYTEQIPPLVISRSIPCFVSQKLCNFKVTLTVYKVVLIDCITNLSDFLLKVNSCTFEFFVDLSYLMFCQFCR